MSWILKGHRGSRRLAGILAAVIGALSTGLKLIGLGRIMRG